ncbi:MAG: TerB family tellurite resistance protein [Pseudomonadota bacterium]|jgi:DnaJ like chaperone protein|nr:molecular chaperone DjlA [Alphaproteobacteria bacterium]
MSRWGKIFGAAAGLALGGPLGALLGAVAGHYGLDHGDKGAKGGNPFDPRGDTNRVAFTIAVIALGAKMAKADGLVTREEVDAFKQIFDIPPDEMANVSRVFDLARKDVAGYEQYARQIAGMFRSKPRVLEDLLDGLFYIAKADDVFHPKEEEFLRAVAGIFGFSDADWSRIRAGHVGQDQADPYVILGIGHDAPDTAVKQAYRRLVRENHPDLLVAQGLPEEFIMVANTKIATINGAYDKIAKQRGML